MNNGLEIGRGEFDDLRKDIKNIKETLQPIADTYLAFTKLGSWAKYTLGIIVAILAIIAGIKQIK